ncbi:MAG: hypothetical protein ACOX5G_00670 [Kiritimatiellia bacterium]|jgi:hypothetical protein
MKTFKTGLCVGILLALGSFWCRGSDEQVHRLFEERYAAWRTWVKEHPYSSTYMANKEFYAIVNLGVPAIPLIVEKIEQNPEDFHLGSAISIISKRRFAKSDWPQDKLGDSITAASMYVQWWKEGRFKTGERFVELYGEWKSLKAGKKDKEAEETYRRIIDLGIPALPYLIEKVEQQPEFVQGISRLSDGALPPTATGADCRQWWEKNKQKFELPPQSESKQSFEKNESLICR